MYVYVCALDTPSKPRVEEIGHLRHSEHSRDRRVTGTVWEGGEGDRGSVWGVFWAAGLHFDTQSAGAGEGDRELV